MTFEPGAVVAGRYRVVRAVRDAFDVVDTQTNRERRLEFVPEVADKDDLERRVRRSARVPSAYVCEVLDSGIDPETSRGYVVVPTGAEPLETVELPLPLALTSEVLKQVCDALAEGHRVGIVHGALDPSSVEIAPDNTAARVRYDRAADPQRPWYLSPEQSESTAQLRPATDVWALGLLAFEMLTGAAYFPRDSVLVAYRAILMDPILPPSERAPELPAGFDAWFAKCVERDPAGRYTDAGEAYAAFRALVVRDRILERRRQYVEDAVDFGLPPKPPPEDTFPQMCLMVVRGREPESEREPPTTDAIREGTYRGEVDRVAQTSSSPPSWRGFAIVLFIVFVISCGVTWLIIR